MSSAKEARILLIAIDDIVLDYVQATLHDAEITIKANTTFAQRLLIENEIDIDCIILDPTTHSHNPLSATQQIQSIVDDVPLIILTAMTSFELAVNALNAGVQKFYTPDTPSDVFRTAVDETVAFAHKKKIDTLLLGHMRNAIRDYQQNTVTDTSTNYPHTLISGDLTLNRDRYEASTPEQDIPLSPTQFRILWMLVKSCRDTLTAHDIALEALGYTMTESEAKDLIKAHIS
ncbi:MAG: hypothetical protein AAF126_11910, partial [Chloroflexota bacterium]